MRKQQLAPKYGIFITWLIVFGSILNRKIAPKNINMAQNTRYLEARECGRVRWVWIGPKKMKQLGGDFVSKGCESCSGRLALKW